MLDRLDEHWRLLEHSRVLTSGDKTFSSRGKDNCIIMHISPTIHYNVGHSYKISIHNTGADEFVAWK